jgi:hypothetical protein
VAEPIPGVDDAPRPGPPAARPATPLVAYTITFRSVPNRTTVHAVRISTEEGWVKLKDADGDVAVFPAGAVLSITRRPAGSSSDQS